MEVLHNISIPGYELFKRISRTGMSSIYLARDIKHERVVALKVLDFDPEDQNDAKTIKRFFQEFVLLRHLNHPNIAPIYERYTGDCFTCIAMEYFPIGDLSQKIRKKPRPHQAVSYLRQIASGLEAVHKEKIIHRDLKPRNILFRDENTLAITDFGIAKVMGKSYGLTLQGIILGTPYYMSPEQIDNKFIDHRSDLYSLGVIFYEMLTGKKPFRGDSLMKIFCAHINDPVPVLPVMLHTYQPIIDRLLAKDPDGRFRSVSDLINCLPQDSVQENEEEEFELEMA